MTAHSRVYITLKDGRLMHNEELCAFRATRDGVYVGCHHISTEAIDYIMIRFNAYVALPESWDPII